MSKVSWWAAIIKLSANGAGRVRGTSSKYQKFASIFSYLRQSLSPYIVIKAAFVSKGIAGTLFAAGNFNAVGLIIRIRVKAIAAMP
jgi:hypothetical protein